MLRPFRTLLVIIAITSSAFGAGNFESIMNAFIATIAKDHPELKTDIRLSSNGAKVPAGHQMGRSAAMDYYTFRPKTWAELSDIQRAEILDHPSLKSFIVSIRNERIYPALSAISPENHEPGWYPVEGEKPKAVEYRVKIDPEEMIKNRPSVVPVTTTEK